MAILKRLSKILLLSLLLFQTSCYSDFEPDIDSTPVVCINANAIVGEPLVIDVTRTWQWSEGDPNEDIDIVLKDADVILYVNDKEYEKVEFSTWEHHDPMNPWNATKSGYKSTYIPACGDKIRIHVHSSVYGDAEGEVLVPDVVPIVGYDVSKYLERSEFSGGQQYDGNIRLLIKFEDPASLQNYYYFKCTSRDGRNDGSVFWIDYDAEPLFTEHVSSLETIVSETSGYTLFTDRMINGETYSIHIDLKDFRYRELNSDVPAEPGYIEMTLYSISQSYYKHVISVWENNDGVNGILGNVGLADPVWECSNVSTKAGVISAAAPSKKLKIYFKDLVAEP